MNYQEKMEEMINKIPKGQVPRLLLHACCAPCSSYCIEYLSKYFKITLYYYNPNIDTKEEYDKRVNELNKFVSEFKTSNPVNVVVENYDNKEYENMIKGYEEDEEGSNRCFICYELRMDKAASYAKKHKFKYFTTTLSISPYKNSNKLNEIGVKLEEKYKVKYLYADFKKKNGYKRSIDLSKQYNLYRQDYCGCKYSKIARDKREKIKQERLEKEKIKVELNNIYNNKIEKEHKKSIKTNMYHFNDIKRRDLIKPLYLKVIKIALILIILLFGMQVFFARVVPVIKYNVEEYKIKKEQSYFIEKLEKDYIKKIESFNITDIVSNLNAIYIYGNHLNIKGDITVNLDIIDDVNLVLIGYQNEQTIDLIYSKNDNNITYSITDNKLNTGFKLDNLLIDNYQVYVEIISNNIKSYYKINNTTNFDTTIYYSLVDNDGNRNKIEIINNKEENTISFLVSKNTNQEVYDIVIDPGHGGSDKGACRNGRCETDYTLKYASILKNKLENLGYKVKLTREDNTYNNGYGDGGRVNIAHESNAKFLISIHLNNNNAADYRGFELYTPYLVEYGFAKMLVEDIKKVSGMPYSNNPFVKVSDGIYTRTMSESDLDNISNHAFLNNYEKFNANLETNYYYMIRETGGYITGAYCDGRDNENKVNFFVNSNKGVESYILELGYIGSDEDINILNKNYYSILDTVAKNIKIYLSE